MRTNEELARQLTMHVPPGLAVLTTSFAKEARGAVIIDMNGRELIDFAGGIGVTNVGHCHPKVVAAIKEQAEKFISVHWQPLLGLNQIQRTTGRCSC